MCSGAHNLVAERSDRSQDVLWGDEAAQPHGGLTWGETLGRHDQNAPVVGRSDVPSAICPYQVAFFLDDLQPRKWLNEPEIRSFDGHGLGDFDEQLFAEIMRCDPARLGIVFQMLVDEGLIHTLGVGQEPKCAFR